MPAAAPMPESPYAESAEAAPETPPLQGDRRASVAIVGAGFTGLSAALHLAEKGVDVIVLDANEPGWGASGRNGGQVNPGLKHDPDQVEADFGRDLGGRMVTFSGNAPEFVFDLIRRHQISCAALQSGTLRSAVTSKAGTEIRGTAEQWLRRGGPVSVLDRDGIHRETGTNRYHSALLDRRGGQLNPLSYARGLARAAMRQGATVHCATRVNHARRDAAGWRLDTPHGVVTAEKLILATNGYTDDLWPGLRRSIVPLFSAIVATEPLPDDAARSIMPSRSSLYEIGNVTVYYRVGTDNRLLIGGRSVQREVDSPEPLRYLSSYASRLWPILRGFRWTHGWSGRLAYTPDHYPHIHEPAENVLICLGYSGRGVAMSSAMGPQLARRIIGGPAEEIDMPVTTIREMRFHSLWRSGVAARVAYGRIRDLLDL